MGGEIGGKVCGFPKSAGGQRELGLLGKAVTCPLRAVTTSPEPKNDSCTTEAEMILQQKKKSGFAYYLPLPVDSKGISGF